MSLLRGTYYAVCKLHTSCHAIQLLNWHLTTNNSKRNHNNLNSVIIAFCFDVSITQAVEK